MDDSLTRLAKQSVAAREMTAKRLGRAVDGIALRLQAQLEEAPNAREPTEAEMTAVRERYLEHKAVDEYTTLKWRKINETDQFDRAVRIFKAVYRLTLFAAAIVILYRAAKG